ncbi:MAG: Co2+/Mg2+ efflux protein ApaG [Pseudomonadota bacterium]
MTTFPYEATTDGITVRVRPTWLADESKPKENRFVWAYQIEVENSSEKTWQLVYRHWQIVDAIGQTQTVDGEGVVGQQPTLKPGDVFRYTSGAPLSTPSGMMGGTYDLIDDAGDLLSAKIPTFSLDSPHETRRPS